MANLVDRVIRKIRRTMLLVTPSARRHALVGRPDLWKMKRRFQYDFLLDRGLTPQDQLVDIGCGSLRGGIPLIRYLEPDHYTGIESRSEAIEAARIEARRARVVDRRPRIIKSDFSDGPKLGHEVDVAFAFSVLFHMDEDVLVDCFRFVTDHLTQDGRFFANVNLGAEQPGHGWREFPLVYRTREELELLASTRGLRFEDLGTLRSLGHRSGVPEQDDQHMLVFTLAQH